MTEPNTNDFNKLIEQAIKTHEAKYHKEKNDDWDSNLDRLTEDFQEFWRLWPGRYVQESQRTYKVGKARAAKVWQRLSVENRQKVLALVRTSKIKTAGTKFLQDAFRWLRDRGWEDWT